MQTYLIGPSTPFKEAETKCRSSDACQVLQVGEVLTSLDGGYFRQ